MLLAVEAERLREREEALDEVARGPRDELQGALVDGDPRRHAGEAGGELALGGQ